MGPTLQVMEQTQEVVMEVAMEKEVRVHSQAIIITGVRPEDERALASKSRCRKSCYLLIICLVQCDSSLRATRQIELAMHRAMLNSEYSRPFQQTT